MSEEKKQVILPYDEYIDLKSQSEALEGKLTGHFYADICSEYRFIGGDDAIRSAIDRIVDYRAKELIEKRRELEIENFKLRCDLSLEKRSQGGIIVRFLRRLGL